MGKVTKKTVFEFEGQEYNYDLNLNAMINFEEITGKDLINMTEGEKFSMKDIRALLFAGLAECHDLTIEEVGKFINVHNIREVSEKIMQAYSDAMPEGEDTGKNKNRSAG